MAAIIIIVALLMALAVLIFKKIRFSPSPVSETAPSISNSEPPLVDADYGLRDPNLNNEQNLIKDYLASHLSALSPTKEVLGGKFYLTDITFPLSNQAVIAYEDGHIALQAEVNYTLNEKELNIDSFKIIKEN